MTSQTVLTLWAWLDTALLDHRPPRSHHPTRRPRRPPHLGGTMTVPATANDLGKQARARYATGPSDWTYTAGRIVAYCDAPQVLIETEDGTKVWWRADLTHVEQR